MNDINQQASLAVESSTIEYMHHLGARARSASRELASASTALKNRALAEIAIALDKQRDQLREANSADLARGRAADLAAPLLDRLELTDARIDSMIEGLRQVAQLPDPVGELGPFHKQPSGLEIGRMRVPLGVVGIIYESRPNVTADAAALCLKAGNATILRGGSEAIDSNTAIAACICNGLQVAGLPGDAVQVVATTDRDAVGALIQMPQFVDVIVPRGGKGLIERISAQARVPVIKHLDGNCHVYIDSDADLEMAIEIAFDAKTYRYGICGAMETLLVHAAVANEVLPKIAARLVDKGVELRACDRAQSLLANARAATEQDWSEEYLAPILAIRIVDDMDDAMEHIAAYGSGHTDAIVSNNLSNTRRFMALVDSSSVMVNAPTCFADGFEYGLGAEIGISTDKLHARGPVGLEGLTTQKFVVLGSGQTRSAKNA